MNFLKIINNRDIEQQQNERIKRQEGFLFNLLTKEIVNATFSSAGSYSYFYFLSLAALFYTKGFNSKEMQNKEQNLDYITNLPKGRNQIEVLYCKYTLRIKY